MVQFLDKCDFSFCQDYYFFYLEKSARYIYLTLILYLFNALYKMVSFSVNSCGLAAFLAILVE